MSRVLNFTTQCGTQKICMKNEKKERGNKGKELSNFLQRDSYQTFVGAR